MSVACSAPRDSASQAIAPVPANRSSTWLPTSGAGSSRECWRMLNSASRARSEVGRVAATAGTSSRRPRRLPPTTRIALGALAQPAAVLRARRLGLGGPVAAAELVAQHARRHLLDHAGLEIAELERAVGDADQPR